MRTLLCSDSTVASSGLVQCERLLRHPGPCLGRVPGESTWRVWCARVCRGCTSHDDPDNAVLLAVFTGDHEAVLAGAESIGCLLQHFGA